MTELDSRVVHYWLKRIVDAKKIHSNCFGVLMVMSVWINIILKVSLISNALVVLLLSGSCFHWASGSTRVKEYYWLIVLITRCDLFTGRHNL